MSEAQTLTPPPQAIATVDVESALAALSRSSAQVALDPSGLNASTLSRAVNAHDDIIAGVSAFWLRWR